MKKNILIAGKGGQGIKGLSKILSKSLVDAGIYIFNYRLYQSLIRGGNNFNIICISDKPVYSFEYDYDIAVVFNKGALELHRKNCKDDLPVGLCTSIEQ